MADRKKPEGEFGCGETIQALMEAAQTLSAGGKDVLKSTETIMTSCFTPGTVGKAHKSLLFGKADKLERLAELYNSAANRLEKAAGKLASGVPEEKVVSEALAYCAFLADQLESENGDCEYVLNMLKSGGAANNSD